jgi:hypothetical protein
MESLFIIYIYIYIYILNIIVFSLYKNTYLNIKDFLNLSNETFCMYQLLTLNGYIQWLNKKIIIIFVT